jgi:hypothetical protein
MSAVTVTTATRTAGPDLSSRASTTPGRTAPSAEARMIANVISAEFAAETQGRLFRRAAERRRERVVTAVTVAACSVAGITAITFAQLLVVAR